MNRVQKMVSFSYALILPKHNTLLQCDIGVSIQVVDIQPFAIKIVTSSEETLDDNNALDATNSYMAKYLKTNLDTDLKFISLTLKYLQSYPIAYSAYSNKGGNLRRLAESTGTEFYYSLFGTATFATSNSIDEILVTEAMEESFSTNNRDLYGVSVRNRAKEENDIC